MVAYRLTLGTESTKHLGHHLRVTDDGCCRCGVSTLDVLYYKARTPTDKWTVRGVRRFLSCLWNHSCVWCVCVEQVIVLIADGADCNR